MTIEEKQEVYDLLEKAENELKNKGVIVTNLQAYVIKDGIKTEFISILPKTHSVSSS